MTALLRTGVTAAILTAFSMTLTAGTAEAAPHRSFLGFDLSGHDDAEIIEVRRGRGADDGAGHDANDDKGGQRGGKGRGADDAPGDDKGGRNGGKGRGRDDGPNHT